MLHDLIEKVRQYRWPILVTLGVLFAVILLWMAAPMIGIETAGGRLILIIVVALLVAGGLVFQRWRKAKKARLLEESFKKQALDQISSTQPDRKAQIEAIRLQFDKAVSALKDSKLGQGQGGTNALYALPWYMLVGPPASGKSTALLRSGLQFPYVGDSGKGVQGIGGTRNCDWWFTNEAVLLDTAGRYMTEDEDREEWFGFLDLLKEYRRGKPINGVLIVMSLQDIVNGSDEQVEWHAKNIRSRVNELVQRLELIFPVYLIFSKCDLLRGFAEFFSNLDRSEREQVWGCTFSQKSVSNDPPHKLFQAEFQVLLDALQTRRVDRLSTAMAAQRARDIFCYPYQLSYIQQKLTHFVELLFLPSAYQENPIFRGFYFTSGTQEGIPSDKILGSVSGWAGLAEIPIEPVGAHDEPKSYFIKNVFAEVVCKDQVLSGPSSTSERRGRLLKLGAVVASALFLVAGVTGLAFSYVKNKAMTLQLHSGWKQALQVDPHAAGQFFAQNVNALARLRAQIDDLELYESEGLPLTLRGGMYRGHVLYEPSKDLYFGLFNSIYLARTQAAMETELRRFVAKTNKVSPERDSDFYYSILKGYLMMADPAHLDPEFLKQELQSIWNDLLFAYYGPTPPAGLAREVDAQIDLYSRSIGQKHIPLAGLDGDLVLKARVALKEVALPERYFARVKREALAVKAEIAKAEPYILEKAMQGQKPVLISKYVVPGLFTPTGWKALFPITLEKVLREAGQEAWVLGVEEMPRKEMEAAIERLYFAEYVNQWKQFLRSIRMQQAGTIPEAVTRLQDLTQKNSPIVSVLKDVDRNTRLEGFFTATKERLTRVGGIFRKPGVPEDPANPVTASFQSLHEFLSPSGDKKEAAIDRYMAELGKALSALTGDAQSEGGTQEFKGSKGLRRVDVLVQELDTPIRNEVRGLLIQPFRVVGDTKTRVVVDELTRSLRQEVTGPCLQMVAGRYPFGKGADEISFPDLAAFFHPQTGNFWKFYQARLRGGVQEENGRWIAKDMEISPAFLDIVRDADLIAQGFFGKGTPDPRLTFEIRPYGVPGVDEIRLEVDGKQLRYRMETEEWHQFVWPGPPETAGASLLIVPSGASQPRIKQFEGRWGLFRLLEAGHVTQVRPSHYQVEWEFPGTGGEPIKIRVDLKAESTKNPFARGLLNRFHCPSQLAS